MLKELALEADQTASEYINDLIKYEYKKMEERKMKKIIKQYETIGEVRTHLGNGQYSCKDNVKKEHCLYSQNGKMYDEVTHDGEVYSLEDVTAYYNEDGSEKL